MDQIDRSKSPDTQPSQRLCSSPCEVIDLSESDNDPMLRLPPRRTPWHSLWTRESLGGIVDLGSPESSKDEDNDLARPIYLSMQPVVVNCNRQGITVPSTAASMPRTPTTAGLHRNAMTPAFTATRRRTTATVNRFDEKTFNTSKTHDSLQTACGEIRNARLRHFGPSTRGD